MKLGKNFQNAFLFIFSDLIIFLVVCKVVYVHVSSNFNYVPASN